MASTVNEANLKEFYEHVYPVEDVVRWITYDVSDSSTAAAQGYLGRREFCFTLIGDIFTRFRSYSSVAELRRELVNKFPEKIDIGAVYNVEPSKKQQAVLIEPLERELVFDIDMSDYDHVRSCCKGKKVCSYCWGWMSTAAKLLAAIMRQDFGFRYILPVFSGRRGIHLWVCDKEARKLTNDERSAIVGYMSVIRGEFKSSVTWDLAAGKGPRGLHPTLAMVREQFLEKAFRAIFLDESDPQNPNFIGNAGGSTVVRKVLLQVLNETHRTAEAAVLGEEGDLLNWPRITAKLDPSTIAAAVFILLYPRLDEAVSTRRDHLLKLPFCVHPGTGSLCCPLMWATIDEFDPIADPPKMEDMLMKRSFDPRWKKPLNDMLADMQEASS